jgi:heptosyltransferase-2
MPKILILRFSSIGDIVLTTPVIRCLKQQVKDAEVHYCTKKSFSSLLEHNPYLDKTILLEGETSSIIDVLKEERYDYIIDLHHNLRTFYIKQRLGVKSFSFRKLNMEKWLLVNCKINRLPPVHIVDRYMATLQSFGVMNDGAGLDYFLSPEEDRAIEQLPEAFRNGYVGIVIGARHATKQLPLEKLILLCRNIQHPVVLLGGREDVEMAEAIIRVQHVAKKIYNACGKFSVNQSAALVKHAQKIITHDTGLMHIAAAFKKEIISIWGNTIPEFGMTPYYGNASIHNEIVEVKPLSCRPCSKIGFDTCPKKHFDCMMQIDVEKIGASL